MATTHNIRKQTRNDQDVFVYGLTDFIVKRFYENHKDQLVIGKSLVHKRNNIKAITLTNKILSGLIYDPNTGTTHAVSTSFIRIPVTDAPDINPLACNCTCLQLVLAKNLCPHIAGLLHCAVDRYNTNSTFLPFDSAKFVVYIDSKNNIIKYTYDDVIIPTSQLDAMVPHPQYFLLDLPKARIMVRDPKVCLLLALYTGNGNGAAPFCVPCHEKWNWSLERMEFYHYHRIVGTTKYKHFTRSIWQQTSMFNDICVNKYFQCLLFIPDNKTRNPWINIEKTHGINSQLLSKTFHKMTAVCKLVMKHTAPAGSGAHKQVEFDGAKVFKIKNPRGRLPANASQRWVGRTVERMQTVKGGRVQFTKVGGPESIANYGDFTMKTSDKFSTLFCDSSSFAKSHFVTGQRRTGYVKHSEGEWTSHEHKNEPNHQKEGTECVENSWLPLRVQLRMRKGLGFHNKPNIPDQLCDWMSYHDWNKTHTDGTISDVFKTFLNHTAILWRKGELNL